jgi:hypothetical protein
VKSARFLLGLSLLMGIFLADAGPLHPQTETWPPIPAEELALKEYKLAPGAHAVLLEREEYYDDVKACVIYHRRIKIFTEEGKQYANVEITYLPAYFKVTGIRARTVRPDGTAVEFTGEIFEKTLAKRRGTAVLAKVFTIPDVQVGSIIEYEFKLQWPLGRGAPLTWFLQDPLPTLHARFTRKAALAWGAYGLPPGKAPTRQKDGTQLLELEDVPAFQEEEFMPPGNEMMMRVLWFYGQLATADTFWRDLGTANFKWIEKFVGNPKEASALVAEVIQPGDSPEEKLRKLYARAQQLRNLSFEAPGSGIKPAHADLKENKNLKDVIRNGYGNSFQVDLLFMAMARAAGFEANYALVSDRSDHIFNVQLPDANQLNTAAIAVRMGDNVRYFEPGMRFAPFGLLPWWQLGVDGLRLDKQGGSFIHTPKPSSVDSVSSRKAELRLLEDGSVEGKLEISYSGQASLMRRLDAFDEDDAGRRKQMESEIKAWLPPGAKIEIESVSPWENSQDPLRVVCKVTIPNASSATGHRVLLPAALLQFGLRSAFQSGTRVHPIYFSFPYQEDDEVTFEVPAGYSIESLPNPVNVRTEFANFQATSARSDDLLRFHRHFALNEIIFPATDYSAVRGFFDKVRASDEQQVVLQASSSNN